MLADPASEIRIKRAEPNYQSWNWWQSNEFGKGMKEGSGQLALMGVSALDTIFFAENFVFSSPAG